MLSDWIPTRAAEMMFECFGSILGLCQSRDALKRLFT